MLNVRYKINKTLCSAGPVQMEHVYLEPLTAHTISQRLYKPCYQSLYLHYSHIQLQRYILADQLLKLSVNIAEQHTHTHTHTHPPTHPMPQSYSKLFAVRVRIHTTIYTHCAYTPANNTVQQDTWCQLMSATKTSSSFRMSHSKQRHCVQCLHSIARLVVLSGGMYAEQQSKYTLPTYPLRENKENTK